MRMTTASPKLPTVNEVIRTVKFVFSEYRQWRLRKRSERCLNDLPDYLQDDIGFDREHHNQR
ncbi:hypothetical protein [Photobacterium sp. Hal280]|uniref:hypothetical protein n=1 Tax=Photobacterium sp. Hal280 TaxID=3035163 RepID=UPI00301E210C